MSIKKKLKEKYFGHLWYFYSHLRHRLFVSLLFSVLVGVLDGFGLAMFLPMLEMVAGNEEATAEGLGNLSFIVDGIESLGLKMNLLTVLSVIVLFFSLKGLARFVEALYRVNAQQFFIKNMRLRQVSYLQNYHYKSFIMADVGRIQNTLTGETERLVRAYIAYFNVLQSLIMTTVYVIMAYLANPEFAALVTVGGVLSNSLFRTIYKRTMKLSKKITGYNHDFHGSLLQLVGHFKYLKATGFIRPYADRLKGHIEDIEEGNKKTGVYGAILSAIREPLVIIIVVLVIMLQVTYFSQTVGLLILSLLFFYRALTFVLNMQTQYNKFLQTSGSLENMTAFEEELSERQEENGELEIDKFEKEIVLKGMSFSYGETNILNDIDLTIRKNKTVAFVGESGSGKTTLVNLIAGLLPISNGSLTIDGYELAQLRRESYQRRIGYITQDPVVFSDTIFNNITLWSEPNDQNLSRFWEVADAAQIGDFIRELPNQHNELLGNNGLNLSGGQKQRISISRELFKDIDVLIMDEATSALDSETEKGIQDNLEGLRGMYTILIVAHRLSTIKSADNVVLLKKGRIEKAGSFHTLIQESETFERMVKLQNF